MRRSGKLILLISLIVLIIPVLFSNNILAIKLSRESTSNMVLIVDKNDDQYYNSIQKAIDDAEHGAFIYVKNGEYNEIINVNKKISLYGEDKKCTLINPISEKNKYAVRLGAQDIKIEKMGIKNRAPGLYSTGIKVEASNCVINNCEIFDTPVGIAVWASETTIKNSNFVNCKDEGIAFLGWKGHECNDNIVLNCDFFNNCDGIELQYSSNNIIEKCSFSDNTHSGIDAIASSNNNNKIIECEIINNKVNGIYFASSSNNEIVDCELKNNNNGNIKMNKNSYNNNIIFSKKDNQNDDKNLKSIYSFLNQIKDIENSKISKILSSLNF